MTTSQTECDIPVSSDKSAQPLKYVIEDKPMETTGPTEILPKRSYKRNKLNPVDRTEERKALVSTVRSVFDKYPI